MPKSTRRQSRVAATKANDRIKRNLQDLKNWKKELEEADQQQQQQQAKQASSSSSKSPTRHEEPFDVFRDLFSPSPKKSQDKDNDNDDHNDKSNDYYIPQARATPLGAKYFQRFPYSPLEGKVMGFP